MLIEDLDLQLFAEDGATDTDTDDNIGGDTDDTGDVYGIDENGNLVITSGDSAKHTDIDTEPESLKTKKTRAKARRLPQRNNLQQPKNLSTKSKLMVKN